MIDIDARYVFTCCTPSLIKFIAGINPYGEIIKKIEKSNKTAESTVCSKKEDWDHVFCVKRIRMKEKHGKKNWM